MEKRNIVGENIRKFRMAQEITQEEVALRSGLSQSYINQLELGRRKYTQKSLELIADALNTPVIEFFKPEEPGHPKISEKPSKYKGRKSSKKEFMALLKDLPEHIVEHYFTLIKLERELLKKS